VLATTRSIYPSRHDPDWGENNSLQAERERETTSIQTPPVGEVEVPSKHLKSFGEKKHGVPETRLTVLAMSSRNLPDRQAYRPGLGVLLKDGDLDL
jgi:hypothetical protein